MAQTVQRFFIRRMPRRRFAMACQPNAYLLPVLSATLASPVCHETIVGKHYGFSLPRPSASVAITRPIGTQDRKPERLEICPPNAEKATWSEEPDGLSLNPPFG